VSQSNSLEVLVQRSGGRSAAAMRQQRTLVRPELVAASGVGFLEVS
jgi:hypothetical protein